MKRPFDRSAQLASIESLEFDVLVIGGGATGLGIAVDAASRGYRTALVEAHDFAKATSSRSTKLVHGGVRYLAEWQFGLVTEALEERATLCQNAPHLVHDLAFVVPRYHWWEGPFYGAGLKLYDALAGRRNIGHSRSLSREETIAAIPNVKQDGLLGGVEYHDAQFDDARMALALARTAAAHGASIANRVRCIGFVKEGGQVIGAELRDEESGRVFKTRASAVINATGVFADELRRKDDPGCAASVEPSRGVHLVLSQEFLPGDHAIMVPHTDDGRVLFVIPWHGRTLVGTTDTDVKTVELEPRASDEDIGFILRNAGRYLAREPKREDILSVFAGLRPLARPQQGTESKKVSREHSIEVAQIGRSIARALQLPRHGDGRQVDDLPPHGRRGPRGGDRGRRARAAAVHHRDASAPRLRPEGGHRGRAPRRAAHVRHRSRAARHDRARRPLPRGADARESPADAVRGDLRGAARDGPQRRGCARPPNALAAA